jgi:nitrate reductase gamma subunit
MHQSNDKLNSPKIDKFKTCITVASSCAMGSYRISFDSGPKVFDVVEFAVQLWIEDTLMTTVNYSYQVETFHLEYRVGFSIYLFIQVYCPYSTV